MCALRYLEKMFQPLISGSVLLSYSMALQLENYTGRDVMEFSVIKSRLQWCGGDAEKKQE